MTLTHVTSKNTHNCHFDERSEEKSPSRRGSLGPSGLEMTVSIKIACLPTPARRQAGAGSQ